MSCFIFFFFIFFETGSLSKPVTSIFMLGWLGRRSGLVTLLSPPVHHDWVTCPSVPEFFSGAGDPNSDPYACAERALPTEPSPQLSL